VLIWMDPLKRILKPLDNGMGLLSFYPGPIRSRFIRPV